MDLWELLATSLPRYCERDSFGSEPINTLTNLSFWVAALIGCRRWRRRRSAFVVVATALLLLVGLCSGLWHWFHAPLLLPLDSVPLYTLVLVVAYRGLDLLAARRYALSVLAVAIAGAATMHALSLGTWLNVASRHGFVLICLAGALWPLRSRAGIAWTWISIGLALYAAALLAKSLDLVACSWNPIGLHWLWHVLGGAAAGISIHGVWLLETPVRISRSSRMG